MSCHPKKIAETIVYNMEHYLLMLKSFRRLNKAVSLLVLGFTLFNISYFVLANENESLPEDKSFEQIKELPQINYKNLKNGKGSVVYVNKKQSVWFITGVGCYTAEQRASILAERLKNLVEAGTDPQTIIPKKEGDNMVVRAGSNLLFTADAESAKLFGTSRYSLAYTWANDTREALGAHRLVKDYSAAIEKENQPQTNKNQVGLASWYGGRFHGRRAADGSRFNKYEFTAAHKSLPFGSLVKVTNLRNKKACVVKITDRGPYAKGRIIDLSMAAASELGMVRSGVSKVKLETIGKY
jgi:rare lipoprotein A (peptidoglycan hydrolase)